jgi:4-hydroxy-3-polyprenylbenzoate decarboxylase
MPAPLNFREFIAKIDEAEGLQRILATVDPLLEIAAITDRCSKSADRNVALLFESIRGSRFRVATNLFGSEKRMALALGLGNLTELTARFDAMLNSLTGQTAAAKLAALAGSSHWKDAAPIISVRESSSGVALPPDLSVLPLLKTAPLDGAPDHAGLFMTLPVVITAAPDGSLNCGMYRVAVVSHDQLAISWSSASGAAAHAAAWVAREQLMPVAIVMGTAPSLTFAATLPLPGTLDEFTFAGLLQGEPLRLRRCGNGLLVPAEAELVIEGYVYPDEVVPSGAFGNHTGFYTPSGAAAAVRVTAVTCKEDMIYPATIVGRPPMEDCWLAALAGRIALSLLKIDVPEVVELYQPSGGIFHGGTIISARPVAGSGGIVDRIRNNAQFKASRLLVLVDEDQDPADIDGVYWRVMNCTVWERDIVVDGEQLFIDATVKPADSRQRVVPDPATAALVAARWREYGFND